MKFLIFSFFIFLMGCHSWEQKANKMTPVSQATPQEQDEINQTLDEIQQFANQLNLNLDFKNFPVVILEEDYLARNAEAFCEFKANGSGGQYIAIMRSTMSEYQLLYKPHGQNSFLFMLLVHEFGHCFYGRAHSENVTLNSSGENIPVTAMVPKSPSLIGMKILSPMKKLYYISEISGRSRDQNFSFFD